jgi:hypothetical protein
MLQGDAESGEMQLQQQQQQQQQIQQSPQSQHQQQQQSNYLSKSNQEKEINQHRPGSYKRRSVRDKNRASSASQDVGNRKCHDPPIITTTAATPQDSPSNTIERTSLKDWEHLDIEVVEKAVSQTF